MEPLRQLPFERKGVKVAQQGSLAQQGIGKTGDARFRKFARFCKLGSFGLGIEQLARNILHHAAHPGDGFIAEQRVIIRRQQMVQDRPECRDHSVASGQFMAQQVFHGVIVQFGHAGHCSSACAIAADG